MAREGSPAEPPRIGGGVSLNLAGFVEQYAQYHLPRAVQLRKGTIPTPKGSLTEGSIFTIHAVASTEMVSLQDSKSTIYTVPLGGESEFSIAYDKGVGGQSSVAIEFKTVADIMGASPRPTMVCALKQCTSSDPKSPVEAGEILIIVGATSKQLNVYSITSLREVALPVKSSGRFTTAPSSVKLPLYKLLHYYKDLFPVRVVAFPDPAHKEMPSELYLCEVTLLQLHEPGCLVSSTMNKNNERTAFSVPLTTPVDVYVMPFYDKKTIEPTYEASNEEIRRRSLPSMEAGPGASLSAHLSQSTSKITPGKLARELGGRRSLEPPTVTPIPRSAPAIMQDGPTARTSFVVPQTTPSPFKGSNGSLLEEEHSYANVEPGEVSDTTRRRNKEVLTALDEDKVLRLLEKLDLSMYKKTFKKEKVTGYALSHLEETTLEKELGMKKQIHRLRLMQVIAGSIDVQQLLTS